ncbi:zeta toxin family protein [Streptomyces zaomyceticus]|uniref:zeta toxin family protein n=1 Tax=Streptomyces zaomyceticus TaxID=68286 RepID=UPI002E1529ED|nr:zeta toxin family protein [Streptomyces zaomyceticus]
MSIGHALDHGYGLLLEGVFRDPAMTIGTAERFAAVGRPVGVVALAVREERSRLDALARFLEGGRWTPPELQDLAYGKVPETVAAAEQSPAGISIVITNRSAADLYSSERGPDGLWPGGPGAVPALHGERARPLSAQESASWLTTYRTVLVEMAARGETTDKSRPVLQRLSHDADTVAAMASPDTSSPVRQQHDSVKPLLHLLVESPPWRQVPPRSCSCRTRLPPRSAGPRSAGGINSPRSPEQPRKNSEKRSQQPASSTTAPPPHQQTEHERRPGPIHHHPRPPQALRRPGDPSRPGRSSAARPRAAQGPEPVGHRPPWSTQWSRAGGRAPLRRPGRAGRRAGDDVG